nr:MAG TPA: rubredoxin iron binding domains containing a [Caudoviricetes sp.]
MLECKVCGTKFNAVIEKHYIARDNGKIGAISALLGPTDEECLYDAFDCPICGCQVIAKDRKRDYI